MRARWPTYAKARASEQRFVADDRWLVNARRRLARRKFQRNKLMVEY